MIHGSVRNDGLITNLPQGCAVEVPCLADANGLQPLHIGELPPACAAVNRACISAQELAVKGGLAGDRGAGARGGGDGPADRRALHAAADTGDGGPAASRRRSSGCRRSAAERPAASRGRLRLSLTMEAARQRLAALASRAATAMVRPVPKST